MNRYSIIQDLAERKCFVCGTTHDIHIHEIFFGTANRKLSIKYGLCVCLCARHHNMSNEGVHFNVRLDQELKKKGQTAFERTYPNESFLKVFGKNYL